MLSEVVFPVKRAGLQALFFATAVVVRSEVLLAGIKFVTVDTLGLASCLVSDDLT